MKAMFIAALLAASIAGAVPALAAIQVFKFNTPEQEQRFQSLSDQLRCLVCQNENLSASNADLAKDLRREIHGMIVQGKTNKQIIDYMVARYGEFVLYKPRIEFRTYLLWFGPFVLIIIGVGVLMVFVRKQGRKHTAALNEEERRRLDDLISRHSG